MIWHPAWHPECLLALQHGTVQHNIYNIYKIHVRFNPTYNILCMAPRVASCPGAAKPSFLPSTANGSQRHRDPPSSHIAFPRGFLRIGFLSRDLFGFSTEFSCCAGKIVNCKWFAATLRPSLSSYCFSSLPRLPGLDFWGFVQMVCSNTLVPLPSFLCFFSSVDRDLIF